MSEYATPDVTDQLAGISPASTLGQLRRQRPEVVRHIHGSDQAIFAPHDDGGLSRAERAAVALRVATMLRDRALQEHYRARLASLDANGSPPRSPEAGAAAGADSRWTKILSHVERVTSDPESASRGDIDGLLEAGLSPHAVLSLSQLVAYVNFQSRVLAGLRMLRDAG
jgi:CMD domain protein